jgi:hypothetical protein
MSHRVPQGDTEAGLVEDLCSFNTVKTAATTGTRMNKRDEPHGVRPDAAKTVVGDSTSSPSGVLGRRR